MNFRSGKPWIETLCLALLAAIAQADDTAWPDIEPQHRPGAYWHWMGSGVDEANLTRELETFHQAGLGGVHIIPIYGAKGYEDRYVEYLSPRWMELLSHTVREATRLGMWVDMTTGTGWNFGGPNIPGSTANAVLKTTTADATAESLCQLDLAGKIPQVVMAFGDAGQSLDLQDKIAPSGKLEWTPAEGAWTVIALWQEPANQVERAAPGGEGYMLNPFQGGALTHYLERFDNAFGHYAGPLPRAMYHDSYEYRCNWSPDLLAAFERRQDYRLQDHLNVFLGDAASEEQARLKHDYREVLAAMLLENTLRPWADWARGRGCLTRNQAHGSPGNLLDLYAVADIPETEMFNKDRDPLISKFASSSAHVMGKPRVAAEFGTWIKEHFQERLEDLRVLADDLFISGANQLLYHGTTYSPADAPWPGWLFYASTQMNPRSAIWHDAPMLNEYLARCQSLLQSSQPDNDLLIYWPIHDLWQNPEGMEMGLSIHHREWFDQQPIGPLARRLLAEGHAFDYISDRQLQSITAMPSGIERPGGNYRALLVPQCTHIPVETLQQLRALAEAGAAIYFEGKLPADVPGLARLEERRAALHALTQGLEAHGDHALGHGRVVVGGEVDAFLAGLGILPESLATSPGLLHLRRRQAEGHLYFLTNHGTVNISGFLPLARPAQSAVLLDPMTGQAGVAALRQEDGHATVRVHLSPGQSIFVRTHASKPAEGPAWRYWETAGAAIPVAGEWTVEFIEGGPALPRACTVPSLCSWTEFPENPEAESFAGSARYAITLGLNVAQAENAWRLDLGAVAESARVRINGIELGALIQAPYSLDLAPGTLKPGPNRLEIDVTNLSANRIRDLDRCGVEWRIFNDINFVNIDYKPFDASNWPLRPSGLLGPVRLIPLGDAPR